MSDFKVDFYREVDGTKPLGEFIKGLDLKMKAKVVANLHVLEEYGNLAREPLSKELEDGSLKDLLQMKNKAMMLNILEDEEWCIENFGTEEKPKGEKHEWRIPKMKSNTRSVQK